MRSHALMRSQSSIVKDYAKLREAENRLYSEDVVSGRFACGTHDPSFEQGAKFFLCALRERA
jgi:hypothetical protein